MKKIILYIATSQDGFIADPEGNVDWLPEPKNDQELEMVGYYHLMDRIDMIVMGSNTYKKVLTFGNWAWLDKKTFVFSYQPLKTDLDCINFTDAPPKEWVERINTEKDIWLMGGAALAQSFAKENLIDEIILTKVCQKLGHGIPLGIPLDNFTFEYTKELFDGMTQEYYQRKL